MALFGVTRYADRTEEERSRLRMTNTEATSWAAMKRKLASIDGELVEAGEEGPDAVAALSTKRQNTRSAEAARAAKATADSSGDVSWVQGTSFKSGPSTNFSMMQGEVSWITTENCAACAKYPHFSEYNMGNMPTNFDWRELGAVSSVKNQAYCGACWSFTTAEDIEGAHYLATGELNSLSVQQMIACSTENYGWCVRGWRAGGGLRARARARVRASRFLSRCLSADASLAQRRRVPFRRDAVRRAHGWARALERLAVQEPVHGRRVR